MKVLTSLINVILLAVHFCNCQDSTGNNHYTGSDSTGGLPGHPGGNPEIFSSSSTNEPSTATTSTTTTTTTSLITAVPTSKTTPNLNFTFPETQFSDCLSSTTCKGLIAGLVIFFILFLISTLLAVWFYLRWRNLRNVEESKMSMNTKSGNKLSKINDGMEIHIEKSDDLLKPVPVDFKSNSGSYYNDELYEDTDSQYANLGKASAAEHAYTEFRA